MFGSRLLPAALCSILIVGCGSVNRRPVEDAPRWMTEKNTVRLEIIRVLLDANDAPRALELIRMMRAEGLEQPELDVLQGVALRQQGLVEDSERLLLRGMAALPKVGEVHRELCVLYAEQQRLDEAVASCTRATELDEHDGAAWNNLGFLLLARGDAKDAKSCLENAVDIDSTNARYRNNLAYAHAAGGDHRAALRGFLTTGTPADAHYNVGTAFERAGDSTTALTYYRRALKYDAKHVSAEEAKKRLQVETSLQDAAQKGSDPASQEN